MMIIAQENANSPSQPIDRQELRGAEHAAGGYRPPKIMHDIWWPGDLWRDLEDA